MNRYHLRIPSGITPNGNLFESLNFSQRDTIEATQLEVRKNSLVFLNSENNLTANIIAVYPSKYTIVERIERDIKQ